MDKEPGDPLLMIKLEDVSSAPEFENSEMMAKAKAILSRWFQTRNIKIVESVIVADQCTTRKDLMPYFKKGQVFEQVSLDCDNLDLVLEKSDGTTLAKISLGELYLRE